MVYTVYEAVNQVNGERYIGNTGRSLKVRKQRHFVMAARGKGARMGHGIRVFGKENFVFRPLVICPDLDYANYVERALIKLYKPEYNSTNGGDTYNSIFSLSDEAKEKISAVKKGNKDWLGKKHTKETKAKMALSRTKYWASREHSRKGYQKKGRPKRGKMMICNGIIYESLVHAAKANGLTRDQLKASMERQKNPGRIIGLLFRYVDLKFVSPGNP